MNVNEWVDELWSRNAATGYVAMQKLTVLSGQTNAVYPYMQEFVNRLNSTSSYHRTRALFLIVANARWDEDALIEKDIDTILSHITDEKPATARQFIKRLPELAVVKPGLREAILTALRCADTVRYPQSMRRLVDTDIQKAIMAIGVCTE